MKRPTNSVLAALGFALAACVVSAAAGLAGRAAAGGEVVHLMPEDKASWSPGRMFAFLRPGHNYGERTIQIETTPSDAVLDLYYVRAGFQKRYEQAEAPATVVLPRRVEATGRDTVTIRASAEGYKAREVTLRVRGSEDELLLELDPLANVLYSVEHSYFGGRGSLSFLTKEAPQVRMQKGKRSFQVALHETARGETLERDFGQVKSPLVGAMASQQAGDDLMVRVAFAKESDPSAYELRSRQSHDPISDQYRYTVDFVPADGGAEAIERAKGALDRISRKDVGACALVFDETLRGALEPASLARALTPRGAFTDRFLRAAMKRLGQLDDAGRVRMIDGSEYATHNPLELSAAMSQASQARGFLAVLRAFVAGLEPEGQRATSLRSLVAPDLGAAEFAALVEAAEAKEAACR